MERNVTSHNLKPYAMHWQDSKGRTIDEPSAADRTPYQRDRDRIIHSDAFRRLQYKTQVLSNQTAGDYSRTRLTHTLEVAQLARTMCRSLGLDEDLGEVVALAHDLGHPPFGHAGEDALNECMKPYGGFYHNDQTVRIVRELECRYGGFDGLNLTWESLEGIAKHNGPIGNKTAPELYKDLDPKRHCTLEGQVAAIADDIAYNHHDLDDALTIGKISMHEAKEALPHFARTLNDVEATYPKLTEHRKIKETIRRMLSKHVQDVLRTTTENIRKQNIKTVEDVRAQKHALVCFSKEAMEEVTTTKLFLREKMYRHYLVNRMAFQAYGVMKDLFGSFMEHRRLLPPQVQAEISEKGRGDKEKARVIANYLSSMTDRSILNEHTQIYGK